MRLIKLCGLSRECDIITANECKPNYIGFIFAKKSKRYVDPEKAKMLKSKLSKEIKAVGVFVNEDMEVIEELVSREIIDVVQLHGQESQDYVAEMKKRVSCDVFQAFRIDSIEDVKRAEESKADMILLDAGEGGTGKAFDWSLLKQMKRPFILAGGLNTENITEALRSVNPYGVDVSSGIETEGLKDSAKMKDFVEKVRKEEQ